MALAALAVTFGIRVARGWRMTKSARPTCVLKSLPRERWLAAAQKAVEIRPENAPEGADLEQLLHEGDKAALLISKYWGEGGVQLTVGFPEEASDELRVRILSHMNAW